MLVGNLILLHSVLNTVKLDDDPIVLFRWRSPHPPQSGPPSPLEKVEIMPLFWFITVKIACAVRFREAKRLPLRVKNIVHITL